MNGMRRQEFEQRLISQGLVNIVLKDNEELLQRSPALRYMVPEGLREECRNPTANNELALAWAECGFPKIEPTHRLAASLMATTMPDDLVDELPLPWRCFSVVIPAGLLSIDEHLIMLMHAHAGHQQVFRMMYALPSAGTAIRGTESTLSGLIRKLTHSNCKFHVDVSPLEATRSMRESELAARLLIGVIAEIGEHRPTSCVTSAEASKLLRTPREKLKPRTFKLMRNVNVDARSSVTAYVRGESERVQTVRSLVRGHWKRQPHGEDRAERKLIHVEPYWRGDESSPIAVRSHIVDCDCDVKPSRPAEQSLQHVYFMQAGEGGPIKIGIAIDVEARMHTLQTGNAELVHLIGSVVAPNARRLESELHLKLADLRLEGEWFSPHERVFAELVRLRCTPFEER